MTSGYKNTSRENTELTFKKKKKMNILFLGSQSSCLPEFLSQKGCPIIQTADPISESFIRNKKIHFAISHSYRHIIKPEMIDFLEGKIINLHISLLPWNRGADPNLWSFLEDTPKGISIHYVDAGIDTGKILFQKEFDFDESRETLASTYETLSNEIVKLFKDVWEQVVCGEAPSFSQKGSGSYHKSKDKEPYLHLLEQNGWNTPVKNIKGKALTLLKK